MEKRAEHVKFAGCRLKLAIADVNKENAENLLIAGENRNVFFTGEGAARPYKNAAFLAMVKIASDLVGVALRDE